MAQGPDFIIIGSPKAGTTYLHSLLAQHPGAFLTTPKEPAFFSLDDRYSLGLDWYGELFEGAKEGQIKGEATTHYADGRHMLAAIPRIRQHFPKAKLIYLVRNPVQRLVSHYRFYLQEIEWTKSRYLDRSGKFPDDYRHYFDETMFRMADYTDARAVFRPSFVEFQTMFEGAFVKTGHYFENIQFVLSHFPEEQLQIWLAEDLFSEPQKIFNEVLDFIGLGRFEAEVTKKVNDFEWVSEHTARNRLRRQLLKNKEFANIARTITPKWAKDLLWSLAGKVNYGGSPPTTATEVTGSDRRNLALAYSEGNRQLGEYLGRDLSEWDQVRA